jgi:hypothetical protein
VQRLVNVADEVRQEHQALRQVIWVASTDDQCSDRLHQCQWY